MYFFLEGGGLSEKVTFWGWGGGMGYGHFCGHFRVTSKLDTFYWLFLKIKLCDGIYLNTHHFTRCGR